MGDDRRGGGERANSRRRVRRELLQDRYAGGVPPAVSSGSFGPATPANVAQVWLLAHQAEQTGMVVSDEMIRDFIKEITQDLVKTAEIQAVLAHAGLTSQEQFFNLMRDELLALELRRRVPRQPATPPRPASGGITSTA